MANNSTVENTVEVNKRVVTGKKRKKKIKKIIIWVVIIVLIAVALLWHFGFIGKKTGTVNTADTYTTFTVMRRDVQNVLTGTGTLQPLDSYNVTALSSGEILEDYFEEGDVVEEDELLMKIDSESLETSLERAENNYEDAKESLDELKESMEDLNIVSDYSGIIQVLEIEVGDEVRAGGVIASIVDRDTMLVDIPFMQADSFEIHKGDAAILTVGDTLEELYGTVKKVNAKYDVNENGVKTVDVTISVANPGAITESTSATAKVGEFACTKAGTFYYNVNETITSDGSGEVVSLNFGEGDYVSEGQVIAVLENEDLEDSITRAERSLKDAKNNLDDAKDSFDNYEIKAPISGTVVVKNYKKGEKIGSGSGGNGNTIAVIYDMSALKFDMNIDELDIDDLSIGQEVVITSDAKSGMEYKGNITKISVQGTTSNGTTYYPITVTVSDYGQNTDKALRAGMNIDAEIILEKVENALVVPVDAVGRGNKVKVVKKTANSDEENSGNSEAYGNGENAPRGENGERPEGMTRPEGEQMPSGMQHNENTESKADITDGESTKVEGEKQAEDTKLPEGVKIPEGAEIPERPQMPENVQRPDGASQNGQFARPQSSKGNSGYSIVPTDTEYEEITVETGISDEEYIEIISGLEEGDVVIVESSGAASANRFGMGMGGYGGMGGMPMGGYGGMNMGARPAGMRG